MKKLLYIGHAFHNKTKSSQFIQDLLKEKYEIKKFDFDPYVDSFDVFKTLNHEVFDVVVFWQIMPSIDQLKKIVSYKQIIFFPMFDGVPPLSAPIWYEYKDCHIINFSKTLHKECKKYGFSSYYVQFFPKPKDVSDWGDEKSVFLWQRINVINPNTVHQVVGFENVSKFYHHQSPDPGHQVIETPQEYQDKVEVSKWFETKQEMEQHLQKSAVYFAPRQFEGIGMSFLDAMAMGRCVIAPNYPTMNEYIQNGVNGYLYNLENPERITLDHVSEIQKNTIEFIKNGYKTWEKSKYKILDWIESNVSKNRNKKLIEKKYRRPQIIKQKKVKLFGCLTIYKFKQDVKSKRWYVFGLPVLKIKQKSQFKKKCYLFGISVLKIVERNK